MRGTNLSGAIHRTPENRGGGLLGRLGKKVGHKTEGTRRNVRIRTDLPESAKICSDRGRKISKNPPKIPGGRTG